LIAVLVPFTSMLPNAPWHPKPEEPRCQRSSYSGRTMTQG